MTAAEIAETLGLALSTVSLWLKRIGLGKRSRLEPPAPPSRYERSRPGELIHVDVKKLGRFRVAGKRAVGNRSSSRSYGWECCHVCVDDATRLACAEALPDERGETAVGFLRRAVAWFAEQRGGEHSTWELQLVVHQATFAVLTTSRSFASSAL